MFTIGETLIENDVATECFACEVGICMGACCTLSGGRGAPLDDNEIIYLQQATPVTRKYLSLKHLEVIDQEGVFEGVNGGFATVCVNHKDCVFAFYEKNIARCSIEQAYFNNEIAWRKPLSCHLFPIRISSSQGDHLRYERMLECTSARENGCKKNIRLYDFLKDALIRKYGEGWYLKFQLECRHRNSDS